MPVCAAEFRHGIGFDVCLGEFAVLVQQFEGGAQICNIGGGGGTMGSSLDTEVGERFSEGLPRPSDSPGRGALLPATPTAVSPCGKTAVGRWGIFYCDNAGR